MHASSCSLYGLAQYDSLCDLAGLRPCRYGMLVESREQDPLSRCDVLGAGLVGPLGDLANGAGRLRNLQGGGHWHLKQTRSTAIPCRTQVHCHAVSKSPRVSRSVFLSCMPGLVSPHNTARASPQQEDADGQSNEQPGRGCTLQRLRVSHQRSFGE
jgi:hypothetical protein